MSYYDDHSGDGIIETPTNASCPEWCQEPHGHPYTVEPVHGLSRLHSRILVDLLPWGLTLTLDSIEYLTADHQVPPTGCLLQADPPTLTGVPLVPITGANLRRLAATLLDGADELDRLQGAHDGREASA